MKSLAFLAILLLVFCLQAESKRRKGRRCKEAVFAVPRPTNGKVSVCCRYKKIKYTCNAGYKLSNGDEILTCKKGRVYGKFPKCVSTQKQTCGKAGFQPHSRPRIVGGSNSQPGDWPWMAAIYRDDQFICGGSLITSSHVLTAAHCFYYFNYIITDPKRYTIWLGRTDLAKNEDKMKQFSKVDKVFVHTAFSFKTYRNDIAIIKLKAPVELTEYVQPICLPDQDEAKARKRGYVIGWGTTKKVTAEQAQGPSSAKSKFALLPIAANEACRKSLPANAPYYSDVMFCAGSGKGKKDACQGDSGGPLVTYKTMRDENKRPFFIWKATGIVSWGIGCAQKHTYGYYTRVSYYKKWIQDVIGGRIQ